MAYRKTTLELKTGFGVRDFTAFGADIDFLNQAFTGVLTALNGDSPREILATGTGILQMVGEDAVLVPIDVDDAGGSIRLTSAFTGVESTGTTFVGALWVTW